MFRFMILFALELLRGLIRACWVRWEELRRGELITEQSASSRRFRCGALVHYVSRGGRHRMAIITRLGPDTTLGQCALLLHNGQPIESAYFDPDTRARGTWHWIEGSLVRAQGDGGNPYREL